MAEIASVDEFDTDLSEVPNWYSLGVHLQLPTSELDKISLAYHHEGHSRCLIELYKCLKLRGQDQRLSWNCIIECLRRMKNHGLADKIFAKRVSPYLSCQQMPPSQQDTSTYAVEGNRDSKLLEVIEIKDDKVDVVATDFRNLFQKCSSVKLKVKQAFENSNVCLTDIAFLVQDQSSLTFDPQATLNDIFGKLRTYCSVLNFGLIKFLVTELLPNDETLIESVTTLNKSIESFMSYAKMSQLAELIKNHQHQQPEGDSSAMQEEPSTKIAKLKVRKPWEDYTIKQFQEAAGKILRGIHDVMLLVTVESGCMRVTWIVSDEIDTDKLIQPKQSYEFVKLIGVIYLTIGDETIYRVEEPDGCETMEAAMLQAIELRNTQAIELFLSLGCNPEVATHSTTTTAVTNIVNIMIDPEDCEERSSPATGINHTCVFGHNLHVQAIVHLSTNNYGPAVDMFLEGDTDITSGIEDDTLDARLAELDADGDLTHVRVVERYKYFAGQLWRERKSAEEKLSIEKKMKNKVCMELEQSKESFKSDLKSTKKKLDHLQEELMEEKRKGI